MDQAVTYLFIGGTEYYSRCPAPRFPMRPDGSCAITAILFTRYTRERRRHSTGAITHPRFTRLWMPKKPLESSSRRQILSPITTCGARIGLALMSVQRGDVTAAAEQYTALKPASGTLLALDMGTIDRRLGLLAKTMDNLDQATVHFEDALAFCRKAGYRPELAWTCHDYAEASGTTPATTSRQYPCWMRP